MYVIVLNCIRLIRLHRLDISLYKSQKNISILIYYMCWKVCHCAFTPAISSIMLLLSSSSYNATHERYQTRPESFRSGRLHRDVCAPSDGSIRTTGYNCERRKERYSYIIRIIIDGIIPVLFIFQLWARNNNMIRFLNHTFALFQRCWWKELSVLFKNLCIEIYKSINCIVY